jgi:putative Holliday junction resolvase
MMNKTNLGKLLALDVGLARIGVAVCDPLRLAARPLTVIHRRSRRDDFADLAQLVQREEIVEIICGLPLNMDGSEGPQAQTVRKWAERCVYALRAILGQSRPLIFWDERLSTFAAQELLTGQGTSKQKPAEDAVAAAVILQSYLDAQRLGETLDFGRIELPVKPI